MTDSRTPTTQASASEPPRPAGFALQAALLYAVLGGAWILFSDQVVEWLTSDPEQVALLQMVKGLGFVAVTALAFWLLLRRAVVRRSSPAGQGLETDGDSQRGRLPWPTILILGLAIVALTVAGVFYVMRQQEARELAQLRAISDHKSRQIVDWLNERTDDANFIARARYLGEAYRRWHTLQDQASGDQLRGDLREFIRYNGFHGAQVLDAHGVHLFADSEAPPGPVPEVVRAAAGKAWAEGRPIRVGPYRDGGDRLRLDFVVALPAAGSGTVLVLQANPLADLFPMLQTWPVPSASGEVVWFRRDGGEMLFLNELRHHADTAAKLRLPLARSAALTTKFLRGTVKPGQAVKGVDYRGQPVFGVVHGVPGTDWFVLAKIDEAELYADIYGDAAWVVLTGLLALSALAVGAYLARQRQELAIAQRVRQSQAERLRALHLLANIADSSTDAIFAKDLEGRYILFNREACRVTGKTSAEVLSQDDRALFPADQAEFIMANDRRVVQTNRVNTMEETLDTTQGRRTFLATKGPLLDGDGKVIGMYGISRDITDLKHAQAALRESEERYRLAFRTSPDAININRLSDGVYLDINEGFERITGWDRADVIGHSSLEVGLWRDPADRERLVAALRKDGFHENMEASFVMKNGEQRVGLMSAHVIHLGGEPCILSITRDITARKEAEAALRRQADELRQRNDELERFNRATVGRELDMIELKKEINELSRQLGRQPPYPLSFLDSPGRSDEGQP